MHVKLLICLIIIALHEFCDGKRRNAGNHGGQIVAGNSFYHQLNGEGPKMKGFVAYPRKAHRRRPLPGVIVLPDWSGQDHFERQKAIQIAEELGYVALAADIYGGRRNGQSPEENLKLIEPFRKNATLYALRLEAALHRIRSFPFVDSKLIATIGYCFGGQGGLNMARLGYDIKCVTSFHGRLQNQVVSADYPEPNGPLPKIKAKILAMTGYDDPLILPEEVSKFEEEMTERGADWELIVYGNTTHSFTVPGSQHAYRDGHGYQKRADRRSWARTVNFFEECFEEYH